MFKLQLTSDTKQIIHNVCWLGAGQFLRLITALFVGAWMARSLGPAQYGLLGYLQAFAVIFGVVAALGFNRILVRELVEQNNRTDKQLLTISTVFFFRLLVACALYLVAYLFLSLSFSDERSTLFLFIGISIIFSPFDCVDLLFQAKSKSKLPVLSRSLAFTVATGLKIYILLHDATLNSLVIIIAFESVLAAIILSLIYFRYGLKKLVKPSLDRGMKLLSESWPEIIAAFSGMLFMRMDQLMLASLSDIEAVGIFTVAAQLSEVWYFIPVAIVASAFPKILPTREHDPLCYYKKISYLAIILVAIAYFAGLTTLVFAHSLIDILYGKAFEESAIILTIHIWCGLFVGFGQVSGAWLTAEKKLSINLMRQLCGLFFNFILNYLLIPKYGATGAATATLISMAIAYFAFDLFHPTMRRMLIIKLRALVFLPYEQKVHK